MPPIQVGIRGVAGGGGGTGVGWGGGGGVWSQVPGWGCAGWEAGQRGWAEGAAGGLACQITIVSLFIARRV